MVLQLGCNLIVLLMSISTIIATSDQEEDSSRPIMAAIHGMTNKERLPNDVLKMTLEMMHPLPFPMQITQWNQDKKPLTFLLTPNSWRITFKEECHVSYEDIWAHIALYEPNKNSPSINTEIKVHPFYYSAGQEMPIVRVSNLFPELIVEIEDSQTVYLRIGNVRKHVLDGSSTSFESMQIRLEKNSYGPGSALKIEKITRIKPANKNVFVSGLGHMVWIVVVLAIFIAYILNRK